MRSGFLERTALHPGSAITKSSAGGLHGQAHSSKGQGSWQRPLSRLTAPAPRRSIPASRPCRSQGDDSKTVRKLPPSQLQDGEAPTKVGICWNANKTRTEHLG
jgi:hypothetical protein